MRTNSNHPPKGSKTKVDPIRRLEDIQAIKSMLKNQPRNYLLFTIGINNGLRIGDILQVKVKDVQHLKVGDVHRVIEQKTGKENILLINKSTHKALKDYLECGPGPDEYLFRSQRDKSSPITVSYANQIIKKWCKQINLTGNYGTHTLRKTFGYIQRVHYGVGFEILCKRFNHSSPSVTMRYLGIENKEVKNILMNDI